MTLLILFFLLSIVFSFLCSIWEAVLLSITPSYANRKMQEGGEVGLLIQEYKKDIDRPLSAILTLNTIAHTVGAIGVGAQAGKVFGETSALSLGGISLSWESLVAGLMTLAILILSEIIPKTIGANSWQSLAPFTIRSIRMLLWVLFPFVWLSQLITKSLKKDKEGSVLSRADFSAMVGLGEEEGALDKNESSIIRNLMKLEKLVVRDIMTPRSVMMMAEENTSLMDFYRNNKPLHYSRIPVYTENQDQIEGMILKDELLEQLVADNDKAPLSKIRRPIQAVNDDKTLVELFDIFATEKIHMAIVIDEFGSLTGLVSMEDLVETLLGMEIVDESDAAVDLQQLARQKWEERARRIGGIE